MFVQDYITISEDLTRRSDVRKHCSQTITRFVWGLKSKIMCAIVNGSYDLDNVEEAFDVALKIDLTFKKLINTKRLVNADTRCSKCAGVWAL